MILFPKSLNIVGIFHNNRFITYGNQTHHVACTLLYGAGEVTFPITHTSIIPGSTYTRTSRSFPRDLTRRGVGIVCHLAGEMGLFCGEITVARSQQQLAYHGPGFCANTIGVPDTIH